MNIIYTIIAFLIGFTLMVLVHEWGHYITGRIFKTKIDEFAIGMGPKIFSKKGKKTNTVFSLRCIPIGGFVKFAGDDEVYGEQTDVKDAADPHLLPNLAVWKRFIIYAAGAFMNIVLGFVLLICLYSAMGVVQTSPPIVGGVTENSPAYINGLQRGDVIVSIDGHDIEYFDQIKKYIKNDKELTIVVKRNDENVELKIIPEYDKDEGRYLIGVQSISYTPKIEGIQENSPAQSAGFKVGDVILKVDGYDVYDGVEVGSYIVKTGEKEYTFTVSRGDDILDIKVTPIYDSVEETYNIGFAFRYTFRPFESVGEVITLSAQTSGEMMSLIFKTLAKLIFKGEGAEDVGGPIAIITVINKATKEGILQVVSIFASLTLNLAVVNMIPFPALDGGKCLLLLIEGIIRKPINKNVEGWLNLVGFAVLMLLMVAIGVKDVFSLFN